MDQVAQPCIQLTRVAHRFRERGQDFALEQLLPGLECLALDVTALEHQHVEHVVDDRRTRCEVLQRVERRVPIIVQCDDLAIDDRLVRHLGQTVDHSGIAVCEVVVVA